MRQILLIFLFIGSFFTLHSQIIYDQILNPSVSVHAVYQPSRPLTDSLGNFKYALAGLQFNIPLYSKFSQLESIGSSKLCHIYLSAGGSYGWPEISFVQTNSIILLDHDFINGNLGVSGIFTNGRKGSWFFSLSSSMAEDIYSISNFHLRATGSGIYKHRVSDGFSYHVGAAYTYAFGKGNLLPIAGFNARISSKTIFMVNLPLSLSLLYRPDKKSSIIIHLKPVGNQHFYSSEGLLPDSVTDKTYRLRFTSIQLGASGKFRVGQSFIFTATTGLNFNTNIRLSEGNTKLIETRMVTSAFLGAGLIYKFGKKSSKKSREPGIDIEDIPEELLLQ
jgi:hypothetical protein